MGDVVIFLDAHNALDWETACWFAQRYPEIGPVKPEFKEMLDRPHKLRTLAAAALERQVIVYGGCMFSCGRAGACLVPEKGMLGGRWMMRRPDLPKLELWPTSLMMGAFYAIPKAVLDRFGGWPALPNFHGAQELSVALLAAAHQVPILFHDGVALWHLFRGKKTGVNPPFDMSRSIGSQARLRRRVAPGARRRALEGLPRAPGGRTGTARRDSRSTSSRRPRRRNSTAIARTFKAGSS